MHSENRTVIGIFSDITAAKRATDEMHTKGISTARLVENDLTVTFTGTAEREGGSSAEDTSDDQQKTGGIKGFFARLFGREDDRSDWKLSSDSESYFQDAYNNKRHLVIIEDCSDISLCRDIIARMGGVAEEQGSHYFQAERNTQRSGAESLDSGQPSSADQAGNSGLGVDVDRMPFAHTIPVHDVNVSDSLMADVDRALDGVSGDADRTPLVGQRAPTSGDRPLGASLIGDDRVHDHGVSNADVSRISSDRIMELDDDDQQLADTDKDHILPDRSFPPPKSQDVAHPGA